MVQIVLAIAHAGKWDMGSGLESVVQVNMDSALVSKSDGDKGVYVPADVLN